MRTTTQRTITITNEQAEFIKANCINLSRFVQNVLREGMEETSISRSQNTNAEGGKPFSKTQ